MDVHHMQAGTLSDQTPGIGVRQLRSLGALGIKPGASIRA